MLPILNLNGYKIANPTILSRISHEELKALFVGYGYTPYFVEGDDPVQMHQKMAATLDQAVGEIRAQREGRVTREGGPPALADDRAAVAQGLDRPEGDQGSQGRGFWRSHQVPFADVRDNPANLKLLDEWMRSYKPEELFDATAGCDPIRGAGAERRRRMSANPHANGGLLRKDLKLPDFRKYAVAVPSRGARRTRTPNRSASPSVTS